MTNLPATFEEAEALTFAHEWIARCREGDFIGLGFAPLHPDAGRAFLRRIMGHHALRNPFATSTIVECAEAGWDDADVALRGLIAEYINRGEALPAVLASYNIRVLDPSRASPTRPRGQKRSSNMLQDIAIVALIMELIARFGLRPTRSQIGRRRQPSACSVACEAATEAGLHRGSEAAIHKLWQRYVPIVAPAVRTKEFWAA